MLAVPLLALKTHRKAFYGDCRHKPVEQDSSKYFTSDGE